MFNANAPIRPGVFPMYVQAGNAADAEMLKRVARLNTGWNVFTAALLQLYKKSVEAQGFDLSFPASRKVGNRWVPRKGFDPTKGNHGAFYFLVEFKAKRSSTPKPAALPRPVGGSGAGGSSGAE